MMTSDRRYVWADILRIMAVLGISGSPAISRLLGVSDSTVRKWRLGVQKPSPLACRRIAQTEMLARRVNELKGQNECAGNDTLEEYVRRLGRPHIPGVDGVVTFSEIEKLQTRYGARRRKSRRKVALELGVDTSTLYRQLKGQGKRRMSPLLRMAILEGLGRRRYDVLLDLSGLDAASVASCPTKIPK